MSVEVRLSVREECLPVGMQRTGCIRQMAQEAARCWFPGMEGVLVEAALTREDEESTWLGRGLAVPHARVAGLPCAAVYVACAPGIAWPEEPADCVALLCVPAECPDLYLQLLSKLVRWRMKGGTPEQLTML